MDSEMPVMNGLEATSSLRRLGYLGPIVGVTGNMMQDDVTRFISAGATEVIGKPLKLERLREVLSSMHLLSLPVLTRVLELEDSTIDDNSAPEDNRVIQASLSQG